MYPNNAQILAGTEQTPKRPLGEQLATIARQLYFSTARRTERQTQILTDVMRGRYPFRTLEHLLEIAQLSTRPEHREALALCIRECSTPQYGQVSLAAAFDAETEAEGVANLEQRRFERERTRCNQERVIETLHAQEIATREAITAVRRTVVQ
jgi:hypothetical protein